MKATQWMVTIFALLSLSACNSFFLQSKDVASDNQWECTEVDENGNWDCDEYDTTIDDALNESLSDSKITSVGPSNQSSYTQAPRATNSVQVNAYQSAAIGSTDRGASSSRNSDSADKSTSRQESETQNTEDIPEYVWLAYEPETPTRIEDLPDNMYAVQLVAVGTKEKATKYVEDATWLVEPTGVRILSNDKPFYVILLGIYETKRNAELAVRSVADDVGKNKPWIRSLKSLQVAIRDANRELGDNY